MNIRAIRYKNPPNHDGDDIRFEVNGRREQGFGYIGKDSNHIGLVRCPKCEKENWALRVATGQCAWCGFDASELEIEQGVDRKSLTG